METGQRTRGVVVAAAAAWLAWPAAPAIADELSLKVGGGVTGNLSSAGGSTGAGLGVGANLGASGNAGLDLNPTSGDQNASSRNFQSSPLTVPDGLDRLSIRGGDGKGQISVIYKFVKTKF